MSEPGSGDLLSSIEVSDVIPATTVDRAAETSRFLAGRELVRMGEADPNYRRLVFSGEAYQQMIGFGMSDRTRELGGALFGYHDDAINSTIITRFIAATNANSNWGSINFSPDDWAQMNHENDRQNMSEGTDHKMVAWFHTHPHDYPPTPLTAGDRLIMKNFFPDHDGPADQSTVILTTGNARALWGGVGEESRTYLASWKWNSQADEARLMSGLTIAAKPGQLEQAATYFNPPLEVSRVVKNKPTTTIEIELEDLEDLQALVTEPADYQDGSTIIDIDIPGGEGVEVPDAKVDPTNNIIEINLDDITPERAKTLIAYIQKNPSGKLHSLIRNVLRLSKNVLPAGIRNEIDLVLLQTPSLVEQIEILDP